MEKTKNNVRIYNSFYGLKNSQLKKKNVTRKLLPKSTPLTMYSMLYGFQPIKSDVL